MVLVAKYRFHIYLATKTIILQIKVPQILRILYNIAILLCILYNLFTVPILPGLHQIHWNYSMIQIKINVFLTTMQLTQRTVHSCTKIGRMGTMKRLYKIHSLIEECKRARHNHLGPHWHSICVSKAIKKNLTPTVKSKSSDLKPKRQGRKGSLGLELHYQQ